MLRREKLMVWMRMLHIISALYNLIFVYTALHEW